MLRFAIKTWFQTCHRATVSGHISKFDAKTPQQVRVFEYHQIHNDDSTDNSGTTMETLAEINDKP